MSYLVSIKLIAILLQLAVSLRALKLKLNWDAMGAITSIACAIHCTALPILIGTLPIFGVDIVQNSYFEWGMIVLAFGIGIYALRHGYLTHHRNKLPLILFSIGMSLLVAKQFFHSIENYFLLVALPLMLFAHYRNYKLCKATQCANPHHKH